MADGHGESILFGVTYLWTVYDAVKPNGSTQELNINSEAGQSPRAE